MALSAPRPVVLASLLAALASGVALLGWATAPSTVLWAPPTARAAVPVRAKLQLAVDLGDQSANSLPTQPLDVTANALPELPHEPIAFNETDQPPFESQLEDMGSVISNVAAVAFPLLTFLGALVAGLAARRSLSSVQSQTPNTVKPMEMEASEDTPLARRGALAALGSFSLMAASPAFAAKSGGRVGGSSFRSFNAQKLPPPPPPTQVPPTTVFVAPAPPMAMSPFGYAVAPVAPFGFGFSKGELLALTAIELGEAFVREQRRQAYLQQQLEVQRKLGQDEAQIQALQQQVAMQEQRMRDLQAAMNQRGVPAPAQ